MLKNKNNEYDDLRGKYARLEGDNRKIGELEMVCQEQHVILFLIIESNHGLYIRY